MGPPPAFDVWRRTTREPLWTVTREAWDGLWAEKDPGRVDQRRREHARRERRKGRR